MHRPCIATEKAICYNSIITDNCYGEDNTEKLEIRFAEVSDIESINSLRRQVCDIHINGRPDIFRADGWEAIEPLGLLMLEAEDSDIIIAVLDGKTVGFAVLRYVHRPESPYNTERSYLHIEEFGTAPDYRRRGIATELIRYSADIAKRRGLGKIELDVWEFNKEALAFYEHIGFNTYRRLLEFTV